MREFVSGRIYLPKDVDHEKVVSVENALRFQLDMVELVRDSNMRTWLSLLSKEDEESSFTITGTENQFSEEDKLQIDVLLNRYCEDRDCELSDVSDDVIEDILWKLPPTLSGTRLEQARKHAGDIVHVPEARSERIFKLNKSVTPIPVVVYEAPKDPNQYSVAELSEWGSVRFTHSSSKLANEIQNNPLIRDILAKSKNLDDKRLYVAPVLMNTLHGDGGLLKAIAARYAKDWLSRGIIQRDRTHEIFIAINTACREVFGLNDVSHESKLNTPEYQHKLQGIEASRRIKNRTISLLIKFGAINVARLYG